MHKGRLEAFSDGVLAILITIMVLELRVPHGGATLASLAPLGATFLSYVLSFIYLGIYWSNHHHLFQATEKVSGAVLWANLHLLFWLSLFPFVTAWAGENGFASLPVAVYGFVLLMAGVAYYILTRALIGLHGKNSTLAKAVGKDVKGQISVVIYIIGITLSFWNSLLGYSLYVAVAILWLVPDRRIEKFYK